MFDEHPQSFWIQNRRDIQPHYIIVLAEYFRVIVHVFQCLADFLKSRVDKPGDVCTMYSKNTKEENTFARDAKYISSTIKSSGIGFSPKSLQALVCMEPVASAVLFKQLMGRLDRYIPGENTYFYDLVDLSLEDVRRNYEETHLPTMKLLAKDIQIINL